MKREKCMKMCSFARRAADVDMIPLNRGYFEGYDDATYQFHALNGKAGDGEYPICYMVARVAVWRQLMGYAPVCNGVSDEMDVRLLFVLR
jgi:hypothetical protein